MKTEKGLDWDDDPDWFHIVSDIWKRRTGNDNRK